MCVVVNAPARDLFSGQVDPLAALTARERWVIEERAGGRSHLDIGGDLGVSRQRVKQIEAKALRKLGAPAGRSLADAHEDERAERRELYWERGRRVRIVELRADPATNPPASQSCRSSRRERLALAAHEAAVAAFLLAACG